MDANAGQLNTDIKTWPSNLPDMITGMRTPVMRTFELLEGNLAPRGLDYYVKSMLNSMLVNKDFI